MSNVGKLVPGIDAFHLPLPSYRTLYLNALGLPSGDSDLTPDIPSGFKLLFFCTVANASNNGVSTVTSLGRGANLYRLTGGTAAANGGQVASTGIMVPGDFIRVNCGFTGLGASIVGLLIPDSGPLKMLSVELNSGDQTLYTVPASKVATVRTSTSVLASANWRVFNSSGFTRNVRAYAVPFGGSPDATNILSLCNVGSGAGVGGSYTLPPVKMAEGDYLVLNSDGAGPVISWSWLYETYPGAIA